MGSSSSSFENSNETRERNNAYILSVSNFVLSTDVRDTTSSSITYITRTTPIVAFTINQNEYKYGYYLVDEIYPKWSVFVKTIPHVTGDKRKRFSEAQEAARKDVERAFGILKCRWSIVRLPARAWKENKIRKVKYACIILHNMILKDDDLALCPDYVPDPPAVVQDLKDVRMDIRDSGVHENLQMDLDDYIKQACIPRLDD